MQRERFMWKYLVPAFTFVGGFAVCWLTVKSNNTPEPLDMTTQITVMRPAAGGEGFPNTQRFVPYNYVIGEQSYNLGTPPENPEDIWLISFSNNRIKVMAKRIEIQ